MADSFKTLNKISSTVLQNQFFLYFLFVLAIINLYKFIATDDMISAGVLLLSGVLTSFFSKNMVVIFAVSLVVTYIYCLSVQHKELKESIQEGFKDEEESEDEDNEDEEDDEDDEDEEDDEGFKSKKGGNTDPVKEVKDALKEGFASKKGKDTVEIDRAKLFGLAFAAEQCRKQGFNGMLKKKKKNN